MSSCPEEIAYRMGFISGEQLGILVKEMPENSYREYLERIIRTEIEGSSLDL